MTLQSDSELREEIHNIASQWDAPFKYMDQEQTLNSQRGHIHEVMLDEIMQLIKERDAARDIAREKEKRASARSLCGCPMCNYHVEAYALSQPSNQKSEE